MKNSIKLVLDLSEIAEDSDLGPDFRKEKNSLKVAAVRQGNILAVTKINVNKRKHIEFTSQQTYFF